MHEPDGLDATKKRPAALQELVDPTIQLDDGPYVWSLPAGWVRIVNALHADLVELLGGYVLVNATQKMGGLRYAIDRYKALDGTTEAVYNRIDRAVEESLRTCEVCGSEAVRPWTRSVNTRCGEHPGAVTPGVRARPPAGL